MRRIMRFVQVQADVSYDPKFTGGPDEVETPQQLRGYVLNRPSTPPQGVIRSWGYRMVEIRLFGGSKVDGAASIRQHSNGIHPKMLQLQTIGRLVPVKASQTTKEVVDIQRLQPVLNGQSYIITSPPAHGLVTSALAAALKTVFEQFAIDHGFTSETPLKIHLSRGYKANSHGHKEGRAADIDAVGGKSLLQWKHEWDRALSEAEKLADRERRAEAIAAEQRRNLGYGLYKALQAHSGWRVNPSGWRVYRNVMQLFGPWTATEGPWKAMQIENPTPEERQHLADQHWVFQAHQDHIHVAR